MSRSKNRSRSHIEIVFCSQLYRHKELQIEYNKSPGFKISQGGTAEEIYTLEISDHRTGEGRLPVPEHCHWHLVPMQPHPWNPPRDRNLAAFLDQFPRRRLKRPQDHHSHACNGASRSKAARSRPIVQATRMGRSTRTLRRSPTRPVAIHPLGCPFEASLASATSWFLHLKSHGQRAEGLLGAEPMAFEWALWR